ncbi:unnamed protein product [Paramecium octaurelia]|uniref:Chromo domain-containing protein n=1 Tax=Paramecium octaurelia TaxID=43137 RepID=A0A8S1S3F9_PAROT|nr:unnamed protein product [Paramecium octaurelia]
MKPSGKKDTKQLNQRSPEKILQKRNNNNQLQYLVKWKDNDEPTWEFEENIRNCIQNLSVNEQELISNQNYKQAKQGIPIRPQQQSYKHPNCSEELLFNKQKEMTQKYCNAYPQIGDEIDSVHLILTQEDCLFEIKWKSRSDGVQPNSDFYQYDQFKVVAPMLFMDFLEICILGYEKHSEIKFVAPGKDNIERTQLIKRILLQNPKYLDTNKYQTDKSAEDVKVNDQAAQLKEKNNQQKKNTIITFMQSEQKQKQTIESFNQKLIEKQVVIYEQQHNDRTSQQDNLQEDKLSQQENQEEQQQLRKQDQIIDSNQNQEEQIDQESISLEQQQE